MSSFEHIVKHLHKQLASFISQWKKKRFLVAVSGGVDSVVLLHALKTLNVELEIAHVNYQLRGKDSNRDEKFVRSLGKKYNVPVHVKVVDPEDIHPNGLSLQELAREIRYEFFASIMKKNKLDLLVLAHHADDQLETVLMNMQRGAGLEGLSGMEILRKEKFRPLLEIDKKVILSAAEEERLVFHEDKSNLKEVYLRNQYRLSIIPELELLFPDFRKEMFEQIKVWKKERQQLIEGMPDHKVQFVDGQEWKLNWINANEKHYYFFFNAAVFNGFKASEVIKFLQKNRTESSRLIAGKTYLELKSGKLTFYSGEKIKQKPSLKKNASRLEISGLKTDHLKKCAEQINRKAIKGKLNIRLWEKGDKMKPLGMKNFKKVSDLLTDLKLSRTEKEYTYVLTDSEKICWLVGFRIDDRVKLKGTEKSTEILHLIVK